MGTRTRVALCWIVLAGSLAARELPKSGEAPRTFIVGLSPFLDASVKDDVYRGLVRFLVQAAPRNATVTIFDAFHLRRVTQVNVPDLRAFDSPKTRANQFAAAIGELKAFLAEGHPKPKAALLQFNGAILVPQFCEFLAEEPSLGAGPLSVLLIGSPLYQDAKEPAFSMVDGYFPSDGHLLASRENSVFGLNASNAVTAPLRVSWVYFGDPWMSDLHREKITRFWGLYFQYHGGELLTLSGDLPTALEGFRKADAGTASAARWTLDPEHSKVEMLRITREVPSTDWLTGEVSPDAMAPPPPATMAGPMRIGIRWTQDIDLDLYAAPRRGAETLFFQHPRSPEGYYYKDHRSSPGREYEFIEFEAPVDLREVEAFVNFYQGSCPGGPHGEVRIEFGGRIYSGHFAISASEGNRGRAGHGQQNFWTPIPVRQILKLSSAG